MSGMMQTFRIVNANGEIITHMRARAAGAAMAMLDQERSQPIGTAESRGIRAVPVGRPDPDHLRQDRHTLQLILESGSLLPSEIQAVERILAFLERPTCVDEIVRAKNLRPDEAHAVEQTIAYLWGKR